MKTLNQLKAERIVTASQGSWKWQKPYRVAEYRARKTESGRILWASVHNSGKLSMPQICRDKELSGMLRGSLHNKPIARSLAVAEMGAARVRGLEGSGWIFG